MVKLVHKSKVNFDPLNKASIPFIAQNRWSLLGHNASVKSAKNDISNLASYLSTLSLFDNATTVDQEVRVNARSDCYRGRGDTEDKSKVNQHYETARSLRCWSGTRFLL